MKIVKKIFLVMLILVVVIAGGFSVWAYTPAQPLASAKDALVSTNSVVVETGDWLIFTPQNNEAAIGYIFYPGGRVDYRAYAPYAKTLAEAGYLVIIPRMPFNLAVFGINKAQEIIDAFPNIKHWVIGGHSLGGSMAADFLAKHPDSLDGLVLVASYPASSDDLSGYTGFVTSISASLDGLATPEKIEASRSLLPVSTTWVVIEGGNHAQFGWYGAQSGDNAAVISREAQQEILTSSTIDLLEKVVK